MTMSNDTGTMQRYGLGGPLGTVSFKGAAGVGQVRNSTDTAFADTYVGNVRANDPSVGPDDGGALIANGVIRHRAGVQSYGVGTGAVVGNARGLGSSDFQVSRTVATQVASGALSFLAGKEGQATVIRAFAAGSGNSVTSKGNSFALGKSNSVTGSLAMAVGSGNTASAQVSVALGLGSSGNGRGGISIGDAASTAVQTPSLGSQTSVASGYGAVMGRQAVLSHQGEWAYSGGRILANADSQSVWITWGIRTTDAVATNMSNGTGSGSSFALLAGTSYAFQGVAAAHLEGGTASKVWTVVGMLRRGGAGVFVGGVAPVPTLIAGDAALAAATLTMIISSSSLVPVATGIAATNIKWTLSGRLTRLL